MDLGILFPFRQIVTLLLRALLSKIKITRGIFVMGKFLFKITGEMVVTW